VIPPKRSLEEADPQRQSGLVHARLLLGREEWGVCVLMRTVLV
jgi:hypothetical protein